MVVYRVQAEFGSAGLFIAAKAMTVAHCYPNEVQNECIRMAERFPTDLRMTFLFKC